MKKNPWSFLISLMLLTQACQPEQKMDISPTESGIPKTLADHRKATISNVNYQLFFDIPKEKSTPIVGTATISFDLLTDTTHVVLDFNPMVENGVKSVAKNGSKVPIYFENGHLTLPSNYMVVGKNEFTIEFTAGDKALNRNDEFLYTLDFICKIDFVS